MIRIIICSLLTLSSPLLAMSGDPRFSFEPLVLGAPVLLTQADLAAGSPSALAGILTGIDSIDTPVSAPGQPALAILYPSDVLLAPVAFTPGSELPAAIPFSGAVPSFQRWLASDDARDIVPQLNLPAVEPSLLAADNSEPLEGTVPLALVTATLGAASLFVRRSRRSALPRPAPCSTYDAARQYVARLGSSPRPPLR
ncbi:MAG: hypothetical protein J0L64_08890 [Acidobacteria bacterium]|nr:hypothetical protein [Acidobacteriota bacterium]